MYSIPLPEHSAFSVSEIAAWDVEAEHTTPLHTGERLLRLIISEGYHTPIRELIALIIILWQDDVAAVFVLSHYLTPSWGPIMGACALEELALRLVSTFFGIFWARPQ